MKMHKIVRLLLCAAFMAFAAQAFAAGKKSIVCVTFPEYDWVMNILGRNASLFKVTLLQDNGTDLHSYQPSVKDIVEISSCDMLVYIGGESDRWVEKVIANAKNRSMAVVNLMEALGGRVREEELVEGMQAEEEEEDGGEEADYDEHVWLSLRNAAVLAEELSSRIQRLDAANAAVYRANTASYVRQLSALDAEYEKVVSAASKKTVLFGDRFPFRYLVDDYGLSYYAAFAGCSAESEASFETIVFLARKVDELDLPAVLTIEKGGSKIANTVVANTKRKSQAILELDSLQSVTKKELKAGRSYLSAMRGNLELLEKALR